MSKLELVDLVEQQPISPPEVEIDQSDLEMAGEWDDDKRREAVEKNQLEAASEPLTYDDSLEYLKGFQKDLMDATLALEQDEEKRGELLEAAETMNLDFELAKFNSPQPIMRLMNEVESHLQSLARMQKEGEGDSATHEGDIQDLRRVRDSLFAKYEQMPLSGEPTKSFESAYGELTGEAPAPHLRNGVNRENDDSTQELNGVKPQLDTLLIWTDQALGDNEVTQQFKEIFGQANTLSAEVATVMNDELFNLYQQHTQGQLSPLDYKDKINELFNEYHEGLDLRTAA